MKSKYVSLFSVQIENMGGLLSLASDEILVLNADFCVQIDEIKRCCEYVQMCYIHPVVQLF